MCVCSPWVRRRLCELALHDIAEETGAKELSQAAFADVAHLVQELRAVFREEGAIERRRAVLFLRSRGYECSKQTLTTLCEKVRGISGVVESPGGGGSGSGGGRKKHKIPPIWLSCLPGRKLPNICCMEPSAAS